MSLKCPVHACWLIANSHSPAMCLISFSVTQQQRCTDEPSDRCSAHGRSQLVRETRCRQRMVRECHHVAHLRFTPRTTLWAYADNLSGHDEEDVRADHRGHQEWQWQHALQHAKETPHKPNLPQPVSHALSPRPCTGASERVLAKKAKCCCRNRAAPDAVTHALVAPLQRGCSLSATTGALRA